MNIITTISDTRFSFNGIQYLKNYISKVAGNKLMIFNCYDNKDVLIDLLPYTQYSLDGVVHTNAANLQEALLPVIYSRSTLGGGSGGGSINQDNKAIRIPFFSYTVLTARELADLVNTSDPFVVSEIQELYIFLSVPSTGFNPATVYKYKVFNKGKGTYGAGSGNIRLSALDLELMYATPIVVDDVDPDDPTTDTVNYGALTTQTISQWLNAQNPAITIQPQDEGYTLFKGTVNGAEASYLWVGAPGTYGTGQTQSSTTDFQLLNQALPSYVKTVTGAAVNNADPLNPIVNAVTNVAGTAGQISVANGSTTPSLSIDDAYTNKLIKCIYNNNTPVTISGTATETIIKTIPFAAGTFISGYFEFNGQLKNTGVAGAKTIKMYITNSSTPNTNVSTTDYCAAIALTAAGRYHKWQRTGNCNITGGSTSVGFITRSFTNASDIFINNAAIGTAPVINPTITVYVHLTVTLANAADDIVLENFQIFFNKTQ